MGIYLLYEITALLFVLALYTAVQDFRTAGLLLFACLPFAPPGISDTYTMLETNDPKFGGFAALLVGFIFLQEPRRWHITVASICALMVLWSVARIMGLIAEDPHARGLEAFFYGIMLTAAWSWWGDYRPKRRLPRWIKHT